MGRGLFLGDIDPGGAPRRLFPFGAHGVEAAYVNYSAAVGLQLGDAEALVARGPGLLSPLQQALRVLLGDMHDAPVQPSTRSWRGFAPNWFRRRRAISAISVNSESSTAW